MFSQVEQIMAKAEAHFSSRQWDLTYPGKAEFSALPKYAEQYPRLFKMAWLLPLQTQSNKRVGSNIADTWLMSHKTAVDKRILEGIIAKWVGPKKEAFEVMDQIRTVVQTETIKIALKATTELREVLQQSP